MAKLNVVETPQHAIRIDKGVPVPEIRRGPPSPYPFEGMLPGDSFFAPDVTSTRLGATARNWTKRRGFERTWTTQKVEGGARIWRVT